MFFSTVKIEGFPCLATMSQGWTLRLGTDPNMETFALPRAWGEQLMQYARGLTPVELDLGGVVIRQLYITKALPSPHPEIMHIELADLRWLWKDKHIERAYNLPRKTGRRRYVGGSWVEERDPDLIVDDIDYVGSTLDGGSPWTSARVVEDVVDTLKVRVKADLPSLKFGAIPQSVKKRSIPVRAGLRLSGKIPQELARVLSYTAGCQLYVSPAGDVVFTDTYDFTEIAQVERAGYPIANSVIPCWTDNSRRRAKSVRVIFTPQYEVRFDFHESTTPTGDARRTSTDRWLENVMPSPDETLLLGSGQTVEAGTIITIDQAFEAYSSLTLPPLATEDIGHDVMNSGTLLGMLEMEYGGAAPGFDADPDWMRRVQALLKHRRQTFRPNPKWLNRSEFVQLISAGLRDPETGERGKSVVYTDYAVRYPQKRLAPRVSDDDFTHRRILGYAENLSDGTPADAAVLWVARDLGVFHVSFYNRYGRLAEVYPCDLDADTIPREQLGWIQPTEHGINLASDHQLAWLGLFTPLPVHDNPYPSLVLSPANLTDLLGRPVGDCNGVDEAQIKVDPNIATMRYRWTDSAGDDDDIDTTIKQAFGLVDGLPDPERLRERLIDALGSGDKDNSEVYKVAQAAAAQYYARHTDRLVGSMTVAYLRPDLLPTGNIQEVRYTVAPNGEQTTTLVMPQNSPTIDLMSFLDEGTRRKLGLELTRFDR